MKKLNTIHKLLLLLSALTASALGQSLLSGTVKNPDGTGFNGVLTFQLAYPAGISSASPCTGPVLALPVATSVTVSNGSLVNPPTLFSSACTLPIGIPYNVKAISQNGSVLFSDQWFISGTTFDIGTAQSVNPPLPSIGYAGVWSGASTYNQGMIVGYNGGYCVSLVNQNTGNIPVTATTYWQAITTPGAAQSLRVGFTIGSGKVGTNVSAMLRPGFNGQLVECAVVIKSASLTVPLTFKINQNGTDIFSVDPTIAAGTYVPGTTIIFNAFVSQPDHVAASDIFSMDITSGSTDWQFTAQLE